LRQVWGYKLIKYRHSSKNDDIIELWLYVKIIPEVLNI